MDSLQQKLNQHGQGHLLQYVNELDSDSKSNLLRELGNLDYADINKYYSQSMQDLKHASDKIDNLLEPLPADVCGSVTKCSETEINQYRDSGRFNMSCEKGLSINQICHVFEIMTGSMQGSSIDINYPSAGQYYGGYVHRPGATFYR